MMAHFGWEVTTERFWVNVTFSPETRIEKGTKRELSTVPISG